MFVQNVSTVTNQFVCKAYFLVDRLLFLLSRLTNGLCISARLVGNNVELRSNICSGADMGFACHFHCGSSQLHCTLVTSCLLS